MSQCHAIALHINALTIYSGPTPLICGESTATTGVSSETSTLTTGSSSKAFRGHVRGGVGRERLEYCEQPGQVRSAEVKLAD